MIVNFAVVVELDWVRTWHGIGHLKNRVATQNHLTQFKAGMMRRKIMTLVQRNAGLTRYVVTTPRLHGEVPHM